MIRHLDMSRIMIIKFLISAAKERVWWFDFLFKSMNYHCQASLLISQVTYSSSWPLLSNATPIYLYTSKKLLCCSCYLTRCHALRTCKIWYIILKHTISQMLKPSRISSISWWKTQYWVWKGRKGIIPKHLLVAIQGINVMMP
jgi:hypothetical protein